MSPPSQSAVRRIRHLQAIAIAAGVMLVLILFVGGRRLDMGQGGLSMLNAEDGTLNSRFAAIEEKLPMLQRR